MKILILSIIVFSLYSLPAQSSRSSGMVSVSEEARRLFSEGKRAHNLGNWEMAKRSYLAALTEDPQFTSSMDALAKVYREENKIDSSIFFFNKSLEIFPRNLEAHQELAAAYQLQSDFDAAIKQYLSLLNHYPGYPEAYYGLARVYLSIEEYAKAIKHSEYAMQLYLAGGRYLQAAESRWLAGRAYLNLDEDQRAIRYFKASKKHFQDKPYYHYYLGLAYLKLDKMKEAQEYLTIAETMGYQVPEYIKDRLEFETSNQ